MEDNAKKFAKRFNDILYEKRVTAADISRQTGISEASMSKYRKGTHVPQGQNLQAIATALNVSVDYLLGTEIPENFATKQINVSATYSIPDFSKYELNIIEKLPELTPDAKQLISETIDALSDGNQNHPRIMKAYFDTLNRLCPSNAK